MFVWGFSSHSRIFHSNIDAIITSEGMQILTYTLYSVFMDIAHWGFFNRTHKLWHGTTLYNGDLRGLVTLSPFCSGCVTTCIKDLGLSRPGNEPRFSVSKANTLPLRHHGGFRNIFFIQITATLQYCNKEIVGWQFNVCIHWALLSENKWIWVSKTTVNISSTSELNKRKIQLKNLSICTSFSIPL